MIPNVADARIARRQDRPVGQARHDARPVAEAAVLRVVQPAFALRGKLHQAAAVGTHPQMAVPVHIQAADALALQRFGQFVFDLAAAGFVHHVQAFVGADIIIALPHHDGVDHPALHADGAVHVLEGGFRQPQKPQTGGREPQVALVVVEHIVDGIVEIVGVHPVIARRVHIGNAAVGGDEQGAVAQIVQVVDAGHVLAGHHVQQLKIAAGNIVAVNVIGGGTHHQGAVRGEGAAVE